MNTPCKLDEKVFGYAGTPIEQARCLLRKVRPLGNVFDEPATLPSLLETLIGQNVDLAVNQVADYLKKKGISQASVGGALTSQLCTTDGSVGPVRTARYFVIHDTSTLLSEKKHSADSAVFPASINTAAWQGNDLSNANGMKTHIFINRVGQSAASHDYSVAQFGTKRELREFGGVKRSLIGLFLHHELAQPRLTNMKGVDEFAPEPGFTEAQYERLALCYIAASVRAGKWMIPALHCVIDLGLKDGHDDPQHFETAAWSAALDRVLTEIGGQMVVSAPGETPAEDDLFNLASASFRGDTLLEAIADGHAELGKTHQRLDSTARIQRALKKLSASHPEYFIDLGVGEKNAGLFGPRTEAAVFEFQIDQGLPKTGVVDSATIRALDNAVLHLEQGNPPLPETIPSPSDGESGIPGPDPGATPVGSPALWTTGSGFAQDKNNPGKGWAKTSGIHGTSQRYSDGTVMMVGQEKLEAKRGSTLYPAVNAKQTRCVKNGVHYIVQEGYCRNGRMLPPATFKEHYPDISGEPGVMPGYSTQFGKSDDLDEGTGSETFGITQTSSEVCGCSVKASILKQWFGNDYKNNPALLTSFVEVYYPKTRRYAKVPLTDVGPSEIVKAKIDLTWAVDQFLGTDGGDDVYFRLVKVVHGVEDTSTTSTGGHGTSVVQAKPAIREFIASPNYNSRNGALISRIVLHFTDNPKLDVVISTFRDPAEKKSAHYVIAKNGDIYQMVHDNDRAWHCKGANANTIGIEHIAAKNEALTDKQEKASIQLIRWLAEAYDISKANINGHRYTPGYNGGSGGTDCPHSLFGARSEKAIRAWIERNI